MFTGWLIPILTLVAGWLLSELSRFLLDWRQDRQKIKQAIYSVLDLLFVLEQNSSSFKAADESKQMEKNPLHYELLDLMIKDDWIDSEEFKEKFRSSVMDIAAFDPLMAQKIRTWESTVTTMREQKLSGLTDSKYRQALLKSNLKITSEGVEVLRNAVRKLSLRCSPILWFQLYRVHRKTATDSILGKVFEGGGQESNESGATDKSTSRGDEDWRL